MRPSQWGLQMLLRAIKTINKKLGGGGGKRSSYYFNEIKKHFFFFLKGVSFLVAQLVKNLPAVRETWVRSLGWGDPLEKGKATHSSILAWKIPWTIRFMGSQRVGHD